MSVTPSNMLPLCSSVRKAHTFGDKPQIWHGRKCGLSREPVILLFSPTAHPRHTHCPPATHPNKNTTSGLLPFLLGEAQKRPGPALTARPGLSPALTDCQLDQRVRGHAKRARPIGAPSENYTSRQKSQSSSVVASAVPITYDEPEPEKKSWFSSAFGERAAKIAGFTAVWSGPKSPS